jgi:hypothetical protein
MSKKYNWTRLRDAIALSRSSRVYDVLDRSQRREAVIPTYRLLGSIYDRQGATA